MDSKTVKPLTIMKFPLTICYLTSRPEPQFHWFMDSLRPQIKPGEKIEIILCDLRHSGIDRYEKDGLSIVHTEPKPNVWQGRHRLTSSDWWAKSSAANCCICLCKSEWIAFIDDRCVLMPGWMTSIREAMSGEYCVMGTYEKRSGMVVENGVITQPGEVIGIDNSRNPTQSTTQVKRKYGTGYFGCNAAMPLEWCLQINGFDETCDSLGSEDTIFGHMLNRNGFPMKFDARMKVIQDRTQPDLGTPLRTDKGVSPNDKSHGLLTKIGESKRAIHPIDLRAMRESVQAGNPFPIPTEPKLDWWDGEKLEDMYVR